VSGAGAATPVAPEDVAAASASNPIATSTRALRRALKAAP
jgi:hypothetical protein